jgi:UDP-2,3-diacylglucosamine hydrolase
LSGSETKEHEVDILSGSMIYVSDTHILKMEDSRGQLLLDLIGRIDAEKTEYLVLNGDIFDFCFGGTDYFRQKFKALGDALKKIDDKGVQVFYVEGNHEFNMSEIGWSGINIVTEKDLSLIFKDGQKIKVTHGDLINEDKVYRVYRGIVKSKVFASAARLVPSKLVDAFSLHHADSSRKRGEYRELNHHSLLEAANAWLDDDFDHGVFGHFHTPYAEPRTGENSGLIVCVESWDRPNALVFKEGAFYRTYFSECGEHYKLTPVHSYF